jgi:hypothetical protein
VVIHLNSADNGVFRPTPQRGPALAETAAEQRWDTVYALWGLYWCALLVTQVANVLGNPQWGSQDGPAGAFVQKYTVTRNTFSDNKLYGHGKASQCHRLDSDCTGK